MTPVDWRHINREQAEQGLPSDLRDEEGNLFNTKAEPWPDDEPSPTLTLMVAETQEFKDALGVYFHHACNCRPMVSHVEDFRIFQETAKQLAYEVARHALKASLQHKSAGGGE